MHNMKLPKRDVLILFLFLISIDKAKTRSPVKSARPSSNTRKLSLDLSSEKNPAEPVSKAFITTFKSLKHKIQHLQPVSIVFSIIPPQVSQQEYVDEIEGILKNLVRQWITFPMQGSLSTHIKGKNDGSIASATFTVHIFPSNTAATAIPPNSGVIRVDLSKPNVDMMQILRQAISISLQNPSVRLNGDSSNRISLKIIPPQGSSTSDIDDVIGAVETVLITLLPQTEFSVKFSLSRNSDGTITDIDCVLFINEPSRGQSNTFNFTINIPKSTQELKSTVINILQNIKEESQIVFDSSRPVFLNLKIQPPSRSSDNIVTSALKTITETLKRHISNDIGIAVHIYKNWRKEITYLLLETVIEPSDAIEIDLSKLNSHSKDEIYEEVSNIENILTDKKPIDKTTFFTMIVKTPKNPNHKTLEEITHLLTSTITRVFPNNEIKIQTKITNDEQDKISIMTLVITIEPNFSEEPKTKQKIIHIDLLKPGSNLVEEVTEILPNLEDTLKSNGRNPVSLTFLILPPKDSTEDFVKETLKTILVILTEKLPQERIKSEISTEKDPQGFVKNLKLTITINPNTCSNRPKTSEIIHINLQKDENRLEPEIINVIPKLKTLVESHKNVSVQFQIKPPVKANDETYKKIIKTCVTILSKEFPYNKLEFQIKSVKNPEGHIQDITVLVSIEPMDPTQDEPPETITINLHKPGTKLITEIISILPTLKPKILQKQKEGEPSSFNLKIKPPDGITSDYVKKTANTILTILSKIYPKDDVKVRAKITRNKHGKITDIIITITITPKSKRPEEKTTVQPQKPEEITTRKPNNEIDFNLSKPGTNITKEISIKLNQLKQIIDLKRQPGNKISFELKITPPIGTNDDNVKDIVKNILTTLTKLYPEEKIEVSSKITKNTNETISNINIIVVISPENVVTEIGTSTPSPKNIHQVKLDLSKPGTDVKTTITTELIKIKHEIPEIERNQQEVVEIYIRPPNNSSDDFAKKTVNDVTTVITKLFPKNKISVKVDAIKYPDGTITEITIVLIIEPTASTQYTTTTVSSKTSEEKLDTTTYTPPYQTTPKGLTPLKITINLSKPDTVLVNEVLNVLPDINDEIIMKEPKGIPIQVEFNIKPQEHPNEQFVIDTVKTIKEILTTVHPNKKLNFKVKVVKGKNNSIRDIIVVVTIEPSATTENPFLINLVTLQTTTINEEKTEYPTTTGEKDIAPSEKPTQEETEKTRKETSSTTPSTIEKENITPEKEEDLSTNPTKTKTKNKEPSKGKTNGTPTNKEGTTPSMDEPTFTFDLSKPGINPIDYIEKIIPKLEPDIKPNLDDNKPVIFEFKIKPSNKMKPKETSETLIQILTKYYPDNQVTIKTKPIKTSNNQDVIIYEVVIMPKVPNNVTSTPEEGSTSTNPSTEEIKQSTEITKPSRTTTKEKALDETTTPSIFSTSKKVHEGFTTTETTKKLEFEKTTTEKQHTSSTLEDLFEEITTLEEKKTEEAFTDLTSKRTEPTPSTEESEQEKTIFDLTKPGKNPKDLIEEIIPKTIPDVKTKLDENIPVILEFKIKPSDKAVSREIIHLLTKHFPDNQINIKTKTITTPDQQDEIIFEVVIEPKTATGTTKKPEENWQTSTTAPFTSKPKEQITTVSEKITPKETKPSTTEKIFEDTTSKTEKQFITTTIDNELQDTTHLKEKNTTEEISGLATSSQPMPNEGITEISWTSTIHETKQPQEKTTTPKEEVTNEENTTTEKNKPSTIEETTTPLKEITYGENTTTEKNEPSTSEEKATHIEEITHEENTTTKKNKPSTSEEKTTPIKEITNEENTTTEKNKPSTSEEKTTPIKEITNEENTTTEKNKPSTSEEKATHIKEITNEENTTTEKNKPSTSEEKATHIKEMTNEENTTTEKNKPSMSVEKTTPIKEITNEENTTTEKKEPPTIEETTTPIKQITNEENTTPEKSTPSTSGEKTTPIKEITNEEYTTTENNKPPTIEQTSTPLKEISNGENKTTEKNKPPTSEEKTTPIKEITNEENTITEKNKPPTIKETTSDEVIPGSKSTPSTEKENTWTSKNVNEDATSPKETITTEEFHKHSTSPQPTVTSSFTHDIKVTKTPEGISPSSTTAPFTNQPEEENTMKPTERITSEKIPTTKVTKSSTIENFFEKSTSNIEISTTKSTQSTEKEFISSTTENVFEKTTPEEKRTTKEIPEYVTSSIPIESSTKTDETKSTRNHFDTEEPEENEKDTSTPGGKTVSKESKPTIIVETTTTTLKYTTTPSDNDATFTFDLTKPGINPIDYIEHIIPKLEPDIKPHLDDNKPVIFEFKIKPSDRIKPKETSQTLIQILTKHYPDNQITIKTKIIQTPDNQDEIIYKLVIMPKVPEHITNTPMTGSTSTKYTTEEQNQSKETTKPSKTTKKTQSEITTSTLGSTPKNIYEESSTTTTTEKSTEPEVEKTQKPFTSQTPKEIIEGITTSEEERTEKSFTDLTTTKRTETTSLAEDEKTSFDLTKPGANTKEEVERIVEKIVIHVKPKLKDNKPVTLEFKIKPSDETTKKNISETIIHILAEYFPDNEINIKTKTVTIPEGQKEFIIEFVIEPKKITEVTKKPEVNQRTSTITISTNQPEEEEVKETKPSTKPNLEETTTHETISRTKSTPSTDKEIISSTIKNALEEFTTTEEETTVNISKHVTSSELIPNEGITEITSTQSTKETTLTFDLTKPDTTITDFSEIIPKVIPDIKSHLEDDKPIFVKFKVRPPKGSKEDYSKETSETLIRIFTNYFPNNEVNIQTHTVKTPDDNIEDIIFEIVIEPKTQIKQTRPHEKTSSTSNYTPEEREKEASTTLPTTTKYSTKAPIEDISKWFTSKTTLKEEENTELSTKFNRTPLDTSTQTPSILEDISNKLTMPTVDTPKVSTPEEEAATTPKQLTEDMTEPKPTEETWIWDEKTNPEVEISSSKPSTIEDTFKEPTTLQVQTESVNFEIVTEEETDSTTPYSTNSTTEEESKKTTSKPNEEVTEINIDLAKPDTNLEEQIDKIIPQILPGIETVLDEKRPITLSFKIQPPTDTTEDRSVETAKTLVNILTKYFPRDKILVKTIPEKNPQGYITEYVIRIVIIPSTSEEPQEETLNIDLTKPGTSLSKEVTTILTNMLPEVTEKLDKNNPVSIILTIETPDKTTVDDFKTVVVTLQQIIEKIFTNNKVGVKLNTKKDSQGYITQIIVRITVIPSVPQRPSDETLNIDLSKPGETLITEMNKILPNIVPNISEHLMNNQSVTISFNVKPRQGTTESYLPVITNTLTSILTQYFPNNKINVKVNAMKDSSDYLIELTFTITIQPSTNQKDVDIDLTKPGKTLVDEFEMIIPNILKDVTDKLSKNHPVTLTFKIKPPVGSTTTYLQKISPTLEKILTKYFPSNKMELKISASKDPLEHLILIIVEITLQPSIIKTLPEENVDIDLTKPGTTLIDQVKEKMPNILAQITNILNQNKPVSLYFKIKPPNGSTESYLQNLANSVVTILTNYFPKNQIAVNLNAQKDPQGLIALVTIEITLQPSTASPIDDNIVDIDLTKPGTTLINQVKEKMPNILPQIKTTLNQKKPVTLYFKIKPPNGSTESYLQDLANSVVTILTNYFPHNQIAVKLNAQKDPQGLIALVIIEITLQPSTASPIDDNNVDIDLTKPGTTLIDQVKEKMPNILPQINNTLNTKKPVTLYIKIKPPNGSTESYLQDLANSVVTILKNYFPKNQIAVNLNAQKDPQGLITLVTIEITLQPSTASPIDDNNVDIDLTKPGTTLIDQVREKMPNILAKINNTLNQKKPVTLYFKIKPPNGSTESYLQDLANSVVTILTNYFPHNQIAVNLNAHKNPQGLITLVTIEITLQPSRASPIDDNNVDIDLTKPGTTLIDQVKEKMPSILPQITNTLNQNKPVTLYFKIKPPTRSTESYLQELTNSMVTILTNYFPKNQIAVKLNAKKDSRGFVTQVTVEITLQPSLNPTQNEDVDIDLSKPGVTLSNQISALMPNLLPTITTKLSEKKPVTVTLKLKPPPRSTQSYLQVLSDTLESLLANYLPNSQIRVKITATKNSDNFFNLITIYITILPSRDNTLQQLQIDLTKNGVDLVKEVTQYLTTISSEVVSKLDQGKPVNITVEVIPPNGSKDDYIQIIINSLVPILSKFLPENKINLETSAEKDVQGFISEILLVINVEPRPKPNSYTIKINLENTKLTLIEQVDNMLPNLLDNLKEDLKGGETVTLNFKVLPPAGSRQEYLQFLTESLVPILSKYFPSNKMSLKTSSRKDSNGFLKTIIVEITIESRVQQKKVDIDLTKRGSNLKKEVSRILPTILPNLKGDLRSGKPVTLKFNIRPPANSGRSYLNRIANQLVAILPKYFPNNRMSLKTSSNENSKGLISDIILLVYIDP